MNVLVSIDANNIVKAGDGSYWCDTLHEYSFWNRYLSVFDEIIAAMRVRAKDISDTTSINRVDGDRVEIREFPMMQGMKGYALGYFKTKRAAKNALSGADCAIIRLPSVTGFAIYKEAKKRGIPVALEVVADPNEAYKPNAAARLIYTRLLKRAAMGANGVAYVTREQLQKIYPCRALKLNKENTDYFTADYSSINLPAPFFAEPRRYAEKKKWKIIHTANGIHNFLKGHDTLIRALKIIREHGYEVEAVFLGDGRMKEYFERLANELHLTESVRFVGLVSNRDKLREYLADSDIFALPTHTEGLPRSVIEAMAVGLPCLSTPVGGIPELLSADCLIPPTDSAAWAEKIMYLIDNPEVLTEKSRENIFKAYEYREEALTQKRSSFYGRLRNITERN